MTERIGGVFVIRDGKVVAKADLLEARDDKRSIFPSPRVSRFESYESPVTGASISSDRQRELDLFRSNAYDERDIGPSHAFAKAKATRKAENAARKPGPEQLDFWR